MSHRSIPATVLEQASSHPSDPAFVEQGVVTNYRELAEEVQAAGRAMLAQGIVHGDRVAIWAPNSKRWVVVALAAQSVGAAIVPINTRYKMLEAAYPIVKTGAKRLFSAGGFMGIDPRATVEHLQAEREFACEVIDIEQDAGPDGWDAFIAEGERIPKDRWRRALDAVGPGDLSDVIFTSGSTGVPKGVRHLHGPSVRQTFNTIAENGIERRDRYLIVNPFFHVFGYTGGWVPGLFAGCTVYPLAVFDVETVLGMIEEERITYLPGPPTIFHSLLEHPSLDRYDVSSLRLSLTGSSDVPVDLIQRMLDRLTFERVIQAYGMTECGTATHTLAEDSARTVATTVGVASTDLEVSVVDTHNRPVAAGTEGEIVVRGYAVMDGYFDDATATAATIDEAGWLHTGDLGSVDEGGYFTVLGRLKDMLIVGGFNVYPAEIEDMLREYPDIEDAAVIGIPDERLGEVACAFVIPRSGLDTEALTRWCGTRMANFKVPRRVEVVDAFPLTASNKVSKVELRALAERKGLA